MGRRSTSSKEKTYPADIKNVLWTFLQVRYENESAQYFLLFFLTLPKAIAFGNKFSFFDS